MEPFSKVELCGVVGKYESVGAGHRFSLCVTQVYKSTNGEMVMDNTWLTVLYFGQQTSLLQIEKGDKVYVKGRLKAQRYMSPDGSTHYEIQIVANEVQKIQD